MRKCIVLNIVDLDSTKSSILDVFISEYLRVLNLTLKKLPKAASQTELHHLTYLSIRKTSFLPSDIVEEARKDVWAKGKKIKNGFNHCSIRLNKRWFKDVNSQRGNPCFKITFSPGKQFSIPIKLDKQLQRFNSFLEDGWTFNNISLQETGKIAVILEKEFPKAEFTQNRVLGIDIGSSTFAALSLYDTKTGKVLKQIYFGRDVAIRQRRYLKRRQKLQSLADKGSNHARRKLEKLKRGQSNFVKTRSGQIAKELVTFAKASKAYIALEKLKNLQGRKRKFRKSANRKINRIPYNKLIQFIESNCEMFEIPIHKVDPYHTSKWCPNCGAVNPGHTSANYSLYKCKLCDFIVNSDRKSSLSVAVKSVLERTDKGAMPYWARPPTVQFSSTGAPVNGLFRPDDIRVEVAVQHCNPDLGNAPGFSPG